MTFLIIFLFLLIFFWFFYDGNFWNVTMILGKKGSGKTSLCAKLARKYSKKYIVYSTVDLPNVVLFDPRQLKDLTPVPNSVLIIDEVSLIWDNRNWKKFDSGFTEWFRYSRQYKCKVFLFSQTWDVDLKIKGLVDRLFLMSRIGKITLIRPVIKKMGISKDSDGNGQLVDSMNFGSIFSWHFIFLPRYYGFFKTYNPPERELIDGTKTSYSDMAEIYDDTKKWLIYSFRLLALKAQRFAVDVYSKISAKISRNN